MELNWDLIEDIAKAIVVLGGAAVSLFQLYARLPKSRGSLARDIEILNMLDKDDPAYKTIRAHVDSRVEEIYGPSETSSRKIRIYSWFHLVLGLVFLSVFAPWAYSLYQQGSLWAILTGFLAVGGLGNLFMAFDEKAGQRTRRPGSAPA